MKVINERCPFNSQCERKKCEFVRKELDCSYYNSNAMPGAVIEDQEELRRNQRIDPLDDMFGTDDYNEDSADDSDVLDVSENNVGKIVMIPIQDLHPHPDNPRKDVGDVEELAASIKANGILQNLTVVPNMVLGEITQEYWQNGYKVIIGHRRLAASKLAGLKELPCAVVDMGEKEQISTMLTENMQRSDLTVIEQAQGFQMMLDMGDSIQTISEKSGFSETTVRRRVEIAKLDREKLKKAEKRQISLSDFDRLSKIEDMETRNKLLDVLGTNNFENRYSDAINVQGFQKKKAKWIEQLRAFATEDPHADYQTKKYIRNYGKWTGDIDVVVPDDADTVKYYFKICEYEIDVYTDKDTVKESAEKAEREERERRDKDRRERIKEIVLRHYDLRADFVAGLSKSDCKKCLPQITMFAANAMYQNRECDLDALAEETGIEIGDEVNDISKETDVKEAVDDSPERFLLTFAYYSLDGADSDYVWENKWDSTKQRFVTAHAENKSLDIVYSFLCSIGYEMSDEEIAMQNGTHEIFMEEAE